MCYCLVAKSCPTLFFATLWIIACQAPLSMRFPRQEYWSGLPFPSSGDLSDPGKEPAYPAWQVESLPSHLGSPIKVSREQSLVSGDLTDCSCDSGPRCHYWAWRTGVGALPCTDPWAAVKRLGTGNMLRMSLVLITRVQHRGAQKPGPERGQCQWTCSSSASRWDHHLLRNDILWHRPADMHP